MRNTKLWSVLFAAVLLCACIAGVLFTGASASDTRIPAATTTYVVGTDGATIRECLVKAAGTTWGKNDVLKIQFSGVDGSVYAKANIANGVSGYTMFEMTTIFRENNTKLPIIIEGTAANRGAHISTAENTYNATNDYYFTNLTFGNTTPFTISAGCGRLVFENTTHLNSKNAYYYGDCQNMDAFIGWDQTKFDANKNAETGLLETGIIIGKGCDGLFQSGASGVHFAAVGHDGTAASNAVIRSYRKAKADFVPLTDEDVQKVREAAQTVSYPAGNLASECVVKPWDTSTYIILDNGAAPTESSTVPDYAQCGARKGLSPVREARAELLSGGTVYLSGGDVTSTTVETFVGNTTVIFAGGRSGLKTTGGYGDCGIRLTNLSMYVGNFYFEVREDNPEIPTWTPWVQPVANSSSTTSKIFGDYHFKMSGGTLGKQTTSSANGYYGAIQATGKVVNEISGGKLWQFVSCRFGGEFGEATPVSTTLPGVDTTLNATVSIHNKISGGEFGGLAADGTIYGYGGFFGGNHDSANANVPKSVCNEISGGTFYRFSTGSRVTSDSFLSSCVYNFISGTAEKAPVFKTHFYGSGCTTTMGEVTNVITGCPQFVNEDGVKQSIYGGCKSGTVNKITNYLGGMPVFDDFFGGCSGAAPASGKTDADCEGVAGTIVNHIALDMTQQKLSNDIWGGNGYHTFGVWNEDKQKYEDKGNSECTVKNSITTNVYSGRFGTLRVESACGKIDTVPMTLNVYGGIWDSNFMAANRTVTKDKTYTENSVLTTNIYDGTFNQLAYMGGQNANNRKIVNNIYGGTFNGNYYGGGGVWAKEIINTVHGGTFNAYYCGGGSSCDSTSVTNNIKGGTFNGNYYGGTAGGGSVTCPIIINNIDNFTGNKSTSKSVYLGNGAPTFSGVVKSVINDFDAGMSYVFGGSSNTQNQPADAEYGIETTINGGTFCGFWGIGGGGSSNCNANVKTVINGGTFNGFSSTMPNAVSGANRNGTTGGNVELEIRGGTFTADVVAGVIYGDETQASDTINGNVVMTIKGGDFKGNVYGVAKPGWNVAMAEGKTCTVNCEQTAGVALSFAKTANFDTFTANGETVKIGEKTNLVIDALTGTLKVEQTEGWLAHDYVKIPATAQYEILESPDVFGSYVADDTILIKGAAVAPTGATIRLGERLGVRILLNQADVEKYGEEFTYTVKLGDTTLASGGYEEIRANNYSILFDGIGLAQFGTKFTVTSPVMEDFESSIVELATMAQTAWANNAQWKAYADAIIEFHNVYNLDQANTMTPAAVEKTPEAVKGALGDKIENASVTLLMSDAAGIRLTVDLTEAVESAKFVVAGKEFAAKIEGNTISADIFFAHEFLADEFVISVQNAEGQVYMTYTASIEAMANQLANDANNEKKDNAEAFLVYIQKAVACK